MQIGDLATQAGVTTRTIRYYEELGIVEPQERTEGGFRLYGADQLRRLQIVQSLKELGFELERIRELFELRHLAETGGDLAEAIAAFLGEQQRQIDKKIACYQKMKDRNEQALEVLRGCLGCSIKVFERDCHRCEMYRKHDEVPDVVECAIYNAD